jgi:hypothetical protein
MDAMELRWRKRDRQDGALGDGRIGTRRPWFRGRGAPEMVVEGTAWSGSWNWSNNSEPEAGSRSGGLA